MPLALGHAGRCGDDDHDWLWGESHREDAGDLVRDGGDRGRGEEGGWGRQGEGGGGGGGGGMHREIKASSVKRGDFCLFGLS